MKRILSAIHIKISLRLMAVLGCAMVIGNACTFQGFATRQTRKAMVHAPYDVVIVPGVPYYDTVVNKAQILRIAWAKHLYDIGATKNIIFSGAAVSTPYYEGAIMKIYADSMGVPAEHTFAENCAEHSVENIWYGLKMARRLGFKKMAVASDPFQMKLLMRFINIKCPEVAAIPLTYKQLRGIDQDVPKINPDGARVKGAFVALRDREARAERRNGTRGRHINFSDTTDVAPCSH